MSVGLNTYDGLIILPYLGIILAVAIYFLLKKEATTEAYFFAKKKIGWLALGASLFSAEFMVALFFQMNGIDLAAAVTDINAAEIGLVALFIMGWTVIPRYIATRTASVPAFLEKQYGRRVSNYVIIASIVLYLVIRLEVTLLFCNDALTRLLGWDIGTQTILIVLLVGIYTIIGGYSAVIYTQAFNALFIVGGIFAAFAMGGSPTYASLFLDAGFNASSVVLWMGLFVVLLWSWGLDQFIVQHMLSVRNVEEMKKGLKFTALLKIAVAIMIPVVGIIMPSSMSLLPESEFPVGLNGIIIASILAVTISSLSSIFSSSAALFTMNMFKPHSSGASERKLVLVGRLATTGAVIAGIVGVPLAKLLSVGDFKLLRTAFVIVVAPIAAIYLVALIWDKATPEGAGWALVTGTAIGLVRLVVEVLLKQGFKVFEVARWFASIHYLAVTLLLFAASVIILLVGSMRTMPIRGYSALNTENNA